MAEVIYGVGFMIIDADDRKLIENGDQLDLQLQVTCGVMFDTPQEAWNERTADTDTVYEVQLRKIPMVRNQVCIECGSPDIDTRPLVARHDGEETLHLWKCGQCSRVAERAKVVFLPQECEVICATN